MKDVALLIDCVVGPVGAERLVVDVGENLLGAVDLALVLGALLLRGVVDADLDVGGDALVAAALVAAGSVRRAALCLVSRRAP